ncbi:MAG: hypothetical protein HYW90_02570 [Candidatus Sungbacteria bacterium]|nr:hypothetical protein [Candidatus Sungbacteria bacterium]
MPKLCVSKHKAWHNKTSDAYQTHRLGLPSLVVARKGNGWLRPSPSGGFRVIRRYKP